MSVSTQPSLPVLPTGSFDAEHPPSKARVEECVHCGFCLPTCPTYALWGEEMDSPRGRIHLVKLALEGEAPIDDTFRKHFDNCLGCMACISSCPSGVKYDVILEAVRPQLEKKLERKGADRWFRRFLVWLFPNRDRLRVVAVLVFVGRKSGIRFLLRAIGLVDRLPARLRALEALSPDVDVMAALRGPPSPLRVAEPRARVAVLEGCVQSVFFPHVNAATLSFLAAERIEVVPVDGQGCCGALELHAGEDDRARARARAIVERFESLPIDHLVVNAAGCGSALRTVHRLFAEDDPFRPRAEAFAQKVRDVFELIEGLGSVAELYPREMRVAYHDACHLSHAQGVRSAPRNLLRRIPGLEIVELSNPEICCGSAGIYNLVNPEPAEELGRKKAVEVRSARPQVLAAANPGCLLQIQRHLGPGIRGVHPIELLADALARH